MSGKEPGAPCWQRLGLHQHWFSAREPVPLPLGRLVPGVVFWAAAPRCISSRGPLGWLLLSGSGDPASGSVAAAISMWNLSPLQVRLKGQVCGQGFLPAAFPWQDRKTVTWEMKACRVRTLHTPRARQHRQRDPAEASAIHS